MAKRLYIKNFSQKTLLAITLLCLSRLNIPLVLTNIYKFQTIASGFHKLFKNDAKIAESLKPATTKNLSQGLATTLSGALKYQWTKFTLGTLYRNAPDRILGIKLPKALNEATAGAALKYHIKRALERSHTISDFSKNLELSAKNSQFSNNTLKIIEELNNGIKQASEELKEKASDLERAITPLKEFGKNYPEFALKPKEALEKLLQEKNGQVAGTAYRDDLGGIDFVWGKPKTKDSNGYGLAHILEKREKQYKELGLTTEQAKERTNELLKEIPNILQKGFKEGDMPGYAAIVLNNSKVILSKFKGDNELKNHYMITSFEMDEKVLRELETIAPLSNDYRDGSRSISNLNEPNLIQNPLTSQEDLLKTQEKPQKATQEPLSEQAKAEKLAKLESEKLESEKEFLTSHQIFLKEAKGNATNQTNKTESLEAIGQTKTSKLKMKLVERKNRSLSKH
ncbi:hypothetical protein HPSH169_05505 [Helicobacter pylori Shi169]|uniref:Phage-Barnase-EndoU-ColicinE5/D-RelE-like nuclease domain-containing protein n=1 Tax=Helicobacter pylori Shi169 TaxID=1163741 RepID=A0A0E0WBT0_HELPX|nr:hypothetical protein HPSH169_05505 [Helicobacter pylori Shi169]